MRCRIDLGKQRWNHRFFNRPLIPLDIWNYRSPEKLAASIGHREGRRRIIVKSEITGSISTLPLQENIVPVNQRVVRALVDQHRMIELEQT